MPSGRRNTKLCKCGCGHIVKRMSSDWLSGHKTRLHKFFERVKVTESCWLWQGANTNSSTNPKKGYGHGVCFGMMATHFILKELVGVDVPSGMEVAHTCDEPSCVNPDHLMVTTHSVNMKQMWGRERRSREGLKGSENGSSKLNEKSVLLIRKLHFVCGSKVAELAKDFKVSVDVMRKAIKGETWKHVRNISNQKD